MVMVNVQWLILVCIRY